MIKYLIWDFDGVLCNSTTEAYRVHNEICSKFKQLPFINSKEEYNLLINNKYDVALSKYLTKNEIEEYFNMHRQIMFKNRYKLKVFNEVLDEIINFKVPSIILTATFEKMVKDVLENNKYSFEKLFKLIIGRETKGGKTEKIKILCEQLEVNNEEIIYIGDTMNDIMFCNEQGIQIIVVSYGYASFKELINHNNVINLCNTQKELIKCIKEILS